MFDGPEDTRNLSGSSLALTAKEPRTMTIDGTASRVVRVVIGLGVLSLTIAGPHTPWGYLGLAPLLSGLTGYCPVCSLPGVNSCKVPVK
jgi:Inner membrane protein YgaP-like, transmembrane domain